MTTNSVFVFFLLGCVACQQAENKSNSPPTWSGYRLLYVEARVKGKGIKEPPYGDIVVLDISDGKKFRITDDEYFDTSPKWDRSGKSVLFQSNRYLNERSRSIAGASGPHHAIVYYVNSGSFSEITLEYEIDRQREFRSTMFDLQFFSGDTVIFRFAGSNELFAGSTTNGRVWSMAKISLYPQIENITVSRSSEYVAFRFLHKQLSRSGRGVAIISVRDSVVGDPEILYPEMMSIGDFSPKGEALIVSNVSTVFSIDIGSREKREAFRLISNERMVISRAFPIGDGRLLLVLRKVSTINENGIERDYYHHPEIAVSDSGSFHLNWLTQDDLDKDYFDFYVESGEVQ